MSFIVGGPIWQFDCKEILAKQEQASAFFKWDAGIKNT